MLTLNLRLPNWGSFLVKMVEEKLKLDMREDIIPAGITDNEFLSWDRGPL